MTENLSKFETGETIIVKRGSKAIEAGTEVKVLARDAGSGKYAVQTATGDVYSLAAERLAHKPERTFTESEVLAAFDQARNVGFSSADATTDYLTDVLGVKRA